MFVAISIPENERHVTTTYQHRICLVKHGEIDSSKDQQHHKHYHKRNSSPGLLTSAWICFLEKIIKLFPKRYLSKAQNKKNTLISKTRYTTFRQKKRPNIKKYQKSKPKSALLISFQLLRYRGQGEPTRRRRSRLQRLQRSGWAGVAPQFDTFLHGGGSVVLSNGCHGKDVRKEVFLNVCHIFLSYVFIFFMFSICFFLLPLQVLHLLKSFGMAKSLRLGGSFGWPKKRTQI